MAAQVLERKDKTIDVPRGKFALLAEEAPAAVDRADVKVPRGKFALLAEPDVKGRSTLEELGRQVGLTARAGVRGVTALPNMVGDSLGLQSSDAVEGAMDKLGLPRPEN